MSVDPRFEARAGLVEMTGRFSRIRALASGVVFCDFDEETTGASHEVVCFRRTDTRLFARFANQHIRAGPRCRIAGEQRQTRHHGRMRWQIVTRYVEPMTD